MAGQKRHPRWATPVEIAARFGRLIRRTRRDKELTLKQVAEKAGITFAYLAKIERGELPPPPTEKLYQLADALGVERSELLWSAGRVSEDASAFLAQFARQCEAVLLLLREPDVSHKDVEFLRKMLLIGARHIEGFPMSAADVDRWVEEIRSEVNVPDKRARPSR